MEVLFLEFVEQHRAVILDKRADYEMFKKKKETSWTPAC